MSSELFIAVIVIVGVLVLLTVDVTTIQKLGKGEESPTTHLDYLIERALKDGSSEGVLSFPGDVCLEVLVNYRFPCRNEEGIFAESAYCFKKDRRYIARVMRNPAGGVCIQVEEMG